MIVKKFKKQWLDKFNVSCVLPAVPTSLLGKKDLLGLLLLIFDLRFKNYRPTSLKKWRKVNLQVRTGLWKTKKSRLLAARLSVSNSIQQFSLINL